MALSFFEGNLLQLIKNYTTTLLHNHGTDFNNFTILCRNDNVFNFSILISRDSLVLNKNTESISLLLFN